jgi:hypothetical protein
LFHLGFPFFQLGPHIFQLSDCSSKIPIKRQRMGPFNHFSFHNHAILVFKTLNAAFGLPKAFSVGDTTL